MGKKLYRVEKGSVLFGVCGGIAEYFNVDPNLVRLLWIILFMGSLWVYIAAAILLPKKSDVYPGY